MKIDEKRKAAILSSLLKPEAARVKDLPETDVVISKSKDDIDKLELSAQKNTIDRTQEKKELPSSLQKEHKDHNFIDKVELSIKKKPYAPVKEKEKTSSTIISQDRINALLETLKPETYNARLEIAPKNMMKSHLFEIVI
jgi:hypothetical protein